MGTYRLELAYLGTNFHGYAKQTNVRTVQGVLEEALGRVIGPVETFVAGRTDKGVHASGQVVSFESAAELECRRLQRSLNKQLGPEVAVGAITPMPPGFHARFSAKSRAYRYRILNREAPDPFIAPVSWHYPTELDLVAMQAAGDALIGEHDFAALCRAAAGRSTVRDLRVLEWTQLPNGVKELYVAASSFCHQMVRSIVALCVDVGRGRLQLEDVTQILAGGDRRAGAGAAPAHGLTLVGVEY